LGLPDYWNTGMMEKGNLNFLQSIFLTKGFILISNIILVE